MRDERHRWRGILQRVRPTHSRTANNRARARPTPGLPASYAPPVLAPILPSPYAGFWLRVVAHLIDDLLLGIGIGILVLIGVAMVGIGTIRSTSEGMKAENSRNAARVHRRNHFCGRLRPSCWCGFTTPRWKVPNIKGRSGKWPWG